MVIRFKSRRITIQPITIKLKRNLSYSERTLMGAPPPHWAIFFIFMEFSANIFPNIMFFSPNQGLAPLVWKILKSRICHCDGVLLPKLGVGTHRLENFGFATDGVFGGGGGIWQNTSNNQSPLKGRQNS